VSDDAGKVILPPGVKPSTKTSTNQTPTDDEAERTPSRAERRQRPPARRFNHDLAARVVAAADQAAQDSEAPQIPVSDQVRALVRGHERAGARRVARRKAAKQARRRNRA
jgi:hypothetical protein